MFVYCRQSWADRAHLAKSIPQIRSSVLGSIIRVFARGSVASRIMRKLDQVIFLSCLGCPWVKVENAVQTGY